MSATLSPYPVWQITDAIGGALPGALLYIYKANTDTLTTTYTDASMETEAANPIVADADGRLSVWLDPALGSVKMILTDGVGLPDISSGRTGSEIWSRDYISPTGSGGGVQYLVDSIADLKALSEPSGDALAQVLGYYEAGDGGGGVFYFDQDSSEANDDGIVIQPTVSTSGRWIRRLDDSEINVRFFGAKGNGTTNDTPYFAAADTYCQTGDATLLADAGTYLLSSDPSLVTKIKLLPNAILKPANDGYDFNVIICDNTQHFTTDVVVNLQAGIIAKPQWWGAVADGATDDTAAVRKAAEALVSGGTIYFEETEDSYLVGDAADYVITLTSNMQIKGAGDTSLLKQKNSTNSTYALIGHNVATALSNISVEGISIDGNMANNTAGIGIVINAIGGYISNCTITGCYNRAIESYSSYFKIYNNNLVDNGLLISGADHLVVSRNNITATDETIHSLYGISVTPGVSKSIIDTDITGNILVGCPIVALAAPTSKTISSLSITNNTVDLSRTGLAGNTASHCVSVLEATSVVEISRNTLYPSENSTSSGIYYGNATTVRACQYDVSGNTIRLVSNDIDTTHNAITVINCSGSVIKNNNIRSSQSYAEGTTTDYGVEELGTCTNIIKSSNVIINLIDYTLVDETSITEGTFDIVFSDSYFTAAQTATAYWKRTVPVIATYPATIQLSIRAVSGTSNATSFAASGTPIPEGIRPSVNTYFGGVTVVDSGGQCVGGFYITSAGVLQVSKLLAPTVSDGNPITTFNYSTTSFANTGTKGFVDATLIYSVWP